MTVSQGS